MDKEAAEAFYTQGHLTFIHIYLKSIKTDGYNHLIQNIQRRQGK